MHSGNISGRLKFKSMTELFKSERVVIRFPVSKSDPESADRPVRTPKAVIWAWLEVGFLVTLTSSVVFSMLAVVVAAGNAVE